MRAKVIKPAIQDQPATFSSIVSKGNLTIGGTITVSGSINISGSEDLTVNDITASGNISASGDIFANTGSIKHITNIDEIRKDADTFIRFEDSKLTLNSFGTTANSILEIGSLEGEEGFTVKADKIHLNSYGNNPFIRCQHSINSTQFFQNITASGNISSSGQIIGDVVDTSFETFLNFESATAYTYIAPFPLTVNFTGSSTSSMEVVGFVTASANTDTFSTQQTPPITLNTFDKLKITPSSSGLFTFSGSRTI